MVSKTTEEKMAARIGKLVRQAEGAPEGSPEREVFMDRAMTLAQAHSIDMAVARAKAYDKEKVEEPEERKYVVGEFGKAKQSAHFVDLVLALGEAFDMKPLISHSNVFVWLMGYPSDHEMVERMYSMLSTQMVADADAALAKGANKVKRYLPKTRRVEIPDAERAWGEPYDNDGYQWDPKRYAESEDEVGDVAYRWAEGRYEERQVEYTLREPPKYRTEVVTHPDGSPVMEEKVVSDVDARLWRVNFYRGFTSQVKRRMKQARQTAMKDAGMEVVDASTEKGLAILDRKEEIADRYDAQMAVRISKRSKGYTGAEVSQHSHHAQVAGQESAQRATYGDERVVD